MEGAAIVLTLGAAAAAIGIIAKAVQEGNQMTATLLSGTRLPEGYQVRSRP